MRRGRRGRMPSDDDSTAANAAGAGDGAKLADAAAAGTARFRRLPARTRPEDMITSQDEQLVPLAETDPNRDTALRWGLGGL